MMILGGIAICITGIVGFALAMRGRVVARGQFCRKCKFALAGIPIESPETRCPECGREVHNPARRRAKLRKKSKLGFGIAVFLFFSGFGFIGVSITNQTSVFISAMPDGMVLQLTDWGLDEALDELVVRTSAVPMTMSKTHQDRAIKLGLENQSNLDVEFDPRWGEVLYLSCADGRMSHDQAGQYIANLDDVKITMRDRVHAGSRWIKVKMAVQSVRNISLTGGSLPYQRTIRVSRAGIVGHEEIKSRNGGGMRLPVSIQVIKIDWMNTLLRYSISLKRDGQLPTVGELLDFGLEYTIEVRPKGEDQVIYTKTMSVDHQIQVIDPNEPIVPVFVNRELAQQVAQSLSIKPIQVTKAFPDKDKFQSTVPTLSITRQEQNLQETISFRVFLRLNDPEQDHHEEIEIGKWVAPGTHNPPQNSLNHSQMEWRVDPKDAIKVAYARETVDRMIQLGKADVILRTDASLAEDDSEIDQVIDLVMIFEDVPLEIVESISGFWNSGSSDWIAGQYIDTPASDASNQP